LGDDPDRVAADAAAAGVALLNLNDLVDLTTLPYASGEESPALDLDQLVAAATGETAPKPKARAKGLDLEDQSMFPTLGGGGPMAAPAAAGGAAPRAGLFSAWSNVKSLSGQHASITTKLSGKGSTAANAAATGIAKSNLRIQDFIPELAPISTPPPAALMNAIKNVQDKTKTKILISKKGDLVQFTVKGKQDQCDLALRMSVAAVCPKVTSE
jgi:hypothetical protein